jgi:hypothetical protein
MVSNQTRLDTQEGEIDDLRRQIHELQGGPHSRPCAASRVDHLRPAPGVDVQRGDGQEPPPEPQTRQRDIGTDERRVANDFSPIQ